MSLEIKAKIVCDGCGSFIEGKAEHLATHATSSYWDAKRKAKAAGWLTMNRAYRRDVHYCAKCADTPQKPIKSRQRKKKCQECREITRAEKADNSYKINMGYDRCPVCNWKRIKWLYK